MMKYFAEDERKFTDMGDIKSYHSVYPIVMPPADADWGPVIRFDNKMMLPFKHEVQNFIGDSIQIIRVMISGTTEYHDSSGFSATLSEKDILLVNTGRSPLQCVLHNLEEHAESESLEIWLLSGQENRSCAYYSGSSKMETGNLYKLGNDLDSSNDPKYEFSKRLLTGTFESGTTYLIENVNQGSRIILFVFSGQMNANGQNLSYRDAVIFKDEPVIGLSFTTETKLFVMEIMTNGKELIL